MKHKRDLLKIFLLFFKIGAFTFGGGYAMLALMENEFVTERHWVTKEEFLDMVALAESTPGPVAINGATYIGYKVGGVLGSIVATVATTLPSFIIIYLISLFFDRFMQWKIVSCAFRGIQVCVVYLIANAGIRMLRGLEKGLFEWLAAGLTFAGCMICTLSAVDFSAIFYILIGGAAGLLLYGIRRIRREDKA